MATEESGAHETGSGGFLDALPDVVVGFLRLLQLRLELAFIELEEERERLREIVVLGVLSFVLLSLGLLFLTLFVVAIFWHTHPLVALAGSALLYLALGVIAALAIRKKSLAKPGLFAATLSELAKDRERLKPLKP